MNLTVAVPEKYDLVLSKSLRCWPQDVEAILAKEPATPEELFEALRRCKWSDSLHIGDNIKGYAVYNMKNATEMWGNYFKKHPERSAEVTWYKKVNLISGTKRTVGDVRYMCEVSADSVLDRYYTDRPPTVYLILLSSENEIIGWVRW